MKLSANVKTNSTMPSTADAYNSMKEIQYVVPTGRFMRNIHRWAAHGMVLCVILHMARAFYTSAYKKPRQFNWVVGMVLFVLTLEKTACDAPALP